MKDVTHCHTVRPLYRRSGGGGNNGKYVSEWKSRKDLDHTVSNRDTRVKRHPVVFDIETTAEIPQRPILWTAFDTKEWKLYVNVRGENAKEITEQKVADIVQRLANERGVPITKVNVGYSVTSAEFERRILRLVVNDPTRVLVGHNVFFDLNLVGKPNDGILDLIEDDWDAATEYKSYTILSRRAGAYGYIYSVVGHSNMDFDPTINIADTRVVSKAALMPGSLKGACSKFDIDVTEAGEHGNLSLEYIEYNIDDVLATYLLYSNLRTMLWDTYGLSAAPENIYSTASIFKDILHQMDVERVHYPQRVLDIISPAYFGGRVEALECGREINDVTYTDFLSQYPTVSALSDVWRYMYAMEIGMEEIDPSDIPLPYEYDMVSDPDVWETYADLYVVVEADGHPLPVRTKLHSSDSTRVYNANVTHQTPTTHHFYDVISAWLLSGDWPDIKAAFRVYPIGEQNVSGAVVGNAEIPAGENVMKVAIEERKELAAKHGKGGQEEQSLKITANSGYGVAAERIVVDDVEYLGKKKYDLAGTYYNPHVAATITAGGRLMLAYGERVANEHGGEMWYCDTDSLVLDSDVVEPVQKAFSDLNPYEGKAGELDVLEVESVEVNNQKIPLEGVTLYAVGEKKYAIYDDGQLLKYTEHALGMYEQFRTTESVEKFWRTLLNESGIEIEGEQFGYEESKIPVMYQRSASTREVRSSIELLIEKRVRYGDWIIQTISDESNSINYLSLDKNGKAIKVDTMSDSGVQIVNLQEEELKDIRDVINSWKQSALVTTANPDVRIVDTKRVTKEATTIEMDIELAVNAILQNAIENVELETIIEP